MGGKTCFRNAANSRFLSSSLCFSRLDFAPLAAEGAIAARGDTAASEDDGRAPDEGARGAADASGEMRGDSENELKLASKKLRSCGRLAWFDSCQSYSVQSDKSTLNFSDEQC